MFSLVSSGLRLGNKLSDEHNINTASSQDPDFCRHEMTGKTVVSRGRTTGVMGTNPKRAIDEKLHDAYKHQNSMYEGLHLPKIYLEKMQVTLGNFGRDNNLSNYLTQVFTALDALARRPDDIGLIQGVIIASQTLTTAVRKIASRIQELRTEADAEIAQGINELRTHLSEYASFNKKIRLLYDNNPLDLQSKRDAVAFKISTYLPIMECNERQGARALYYNGHILTHDDFIASLHFTGTSYISADSANLSGIKIEICDVTQELMNGGSGTLSNLLKLRDETLPNLQAELDEFSFALREWMNTYHNNGASYNLQNVKIGTQHFPNGGGTSFTDPQGMACITVSDQDRKFVAHIDLDLQNYVTLQDAIGAINAGLNGSATASITPEGYFKIEATNPSHGISIIDLDPPSSVGTTDGNTISFAHFLGLQDFFITPGLENGVRSPGIASVLNVNPYYSDNPEFFECGMLSKNRPSTPDPNAPPILEESDARTVQLMQDLAEQRIAFEQAGFMPKFDEETMLNYVQNVIEDFAVQTDKAAHIFDAEREIFEDLEDNVKNYSQPNVQEEIQALLFCQMYMQALMGAFGILRTNNDRISQLLLNS